MFLKLVLAGVVAGLALCFPRFQNLIPNGDSVLNPCDGSAWPGVGHRNSSGGGLRNQFGVDFAAANHTWTAELCHKDSDGDGHTNGQELGDANCDWTADNPHAHEDAVTGHPGVCEPVESSRCRESWFTCTTHGPPVGR